MKFIKKHKIFSFSLFTGLLIILLQIFRWEIFSFAPLFEIFLELFIQGVFILSIIVSFVSYIKSKKRHNKNAVLSLLINSISLVIIIFVPFTNIILNIDFKKNRPAREEVVKLVSSGNLKPNVSDNMNLIHLPDKYKNLSNGGGDIIIHKTNTGTAVFFFTFRGILGSFSGFTYCPNDISSCIDNFASKKDIIQTDKLSDNWYWISSH